MWLVRSGWAGVQARAGARDLPNGGMLEAFGGSVRYFGRVVAPSGGTTFMTNEVAFSVGPNGPGTLFFTGGRLCR